MSQFPPDCNSDSVMSRSEALRWAAVAAIALVVLFADVPGHARYVAVLQDSAHGPAFAVLFLLIAHSLHRRASPSESTVATVTRQLLLARSPSSAL